MRINEALLYKITVTNNTGNTVDIEYHTTQIAVQNRAAFFVKKGYKTKIDIQPSEKLNISKYNEFYITLK